MAAGAGLARVVEKPLSAAVGAQPEAEAEQLAEERWKPVLELRCQLTVELALPEFKIADLLKLRTGSVINAHWRVGQDVPLRLNATLIGWTEFEVVGGKLAVRLTELA
jgi:flagellar motor switch/type III secretory pathway protein FliN